MDEQRVFSPKTCEECKKVCIPLPSHYDLSRSTWYCEPCHKCFPMEADVAGMILTAEERMKK